ncbi:MAG: toll/interleukin-1 receptor domain-containing protein [Pseudomonadota bacterium]
MSFDIFISYRRDDSQMEANLTYEMLKQVFGVEAVFMDRATIKPGAKWPKRIRCALGEARVVLVLIKDLGVWMGVDPGIGSRKIDDEEDWVRQELENAIKGHSRNSQEIISLMKKVDAISKENKNKLPECVKELFEFQSLVIDWENIVESRETILRVCRQAGILPINRLINNPQQYGRFAILARSMNEMNSNRQFLPYIDAHQNDLRNFVHSVIPVQRTKKLHDIAQDIQVDALGRFNQKLRVSVLGELKFEFQDQHLLIQKSLREIKELQHGLTEASVDQRWINEFVRKLRRIDTAISNDNAPLFKENVYALGSLLKIQQTDLNKRLINLLNKDLGLRDIEEKLVEAINPPVQENTEKPREDIRQACEALRAFVDEFLLLGKIHDYWQEIDQQLFHLEMLTSPGNPELDMDDIEETLEKVAHSIEETIRLRELQGLSYLVESMRQNLCQLRDILNQYEEDIGASRDLYSSLIHYSYPARKLFRGVDKLLRQQCNDLLTLGELVKELLSSSVSRG